MLNTLKQNATKGLLNEHVFKKNIHFFEWLEKSFEEKREYRLNSENWSLQNLLDPVISNNNNYRYALKKKDREFCDLLESFSKLRKYQAFEELSRYFSMYKTFSIRFLRYEAVYKKALSLIKSNEIPDTFGKEKDEIENKYYELYSNVKKIKIDLEYKKECKFIIEVKTLIFFGVTIDDFIRVLNSTGYSYSLEVEQEIKYYFYFQYILDYLPFLELYTVPLANKKYNPLFNFGQWVE